MVGMQWVGGMRGWVAWEGWCWIPHPDPVVVSYEENEDQNMEEPVAGGDSAAGMMAKEPAADEEEGAEAPSSGSGADSEISEAGSKRLRLSPGDKEKGP
jgi:hypothetical protein